MVLSIEKEDSKFRVITQDFSTSWLPLTSENRKGCFPSFVARFFRQTVIYIATTRLSCW